ncbi:hypothetical protein D4764_05G0014060 [Takifugu flavidus]|uniref:Uncharacterized protein n=1 Tax=Takifugu flavidus TaxID=433684 RepID=A0A5C6N269_9TELE|nr:hypothetical protein D4764_05G0014060 [Takifugu flavidus]
MDPPLIQKPTTHTTNQDPSQPTNTPLRTSLQLFNPIHVNPNNQASHLGTPPTQRTESPYFTYPPMDPPGTQLSGVTNTQDIISITPSPHSNDSSHSPGNSVPSFTQGPPAEIHRDLIQLSIPSQYNLQGAKMMSSLPPPTLELSQDTTSLTNTTYGPNHHIARPNRKVQDWSFKGRRPILILGDSNIKRIPGHTNPNIQLDSYPGANTYHFLKICEKTLPNPNTKIVIFSIGINNRDQDPRKTTIKQLKLLVRTAKSTFPNADIYFPILNYSTQLTQEQQNNLEFINNTMASYCPTLPAIPRHLHNGKGQHPLDPGYGRKDF